MKQLLAALAAGAVVALAVTACGAGADQPVRQPPVMDTVAWQASGDGRADDAASFAPNVYYSATSSSPNVPDPGRKTASGLPFGQSTIVAHQVAGQAMVAAFGAPGEPVACTITVNGSVVAQQAGNGSVTCSWSGPTPF